MPNFKDLLIMAGVAGLVIAAVVAHKAANASNAAPAPAALDLMGWLSASGSPDVAQSANYWDLYTMAPPPGQGDTVVASAKWYLGPNLGAYQG